MTIDDLDCFEFFKIFCFPNELFFPSSILRALHSIDSCTAKIKHIRSMHAVLTNHITDIWHFNNNKQIFHAFLFNIRNYSPKVKNIKRRQAELNIMLKRVNNFDIKQNTSQNICFIIPQASTKQKVGEC